MKNITMAVAGLGLLLAGSAHADTNMGNFGPYATVNSNEAAHKGAQVEVSAEGRMSAYAPVKAAEGHAQIAISSEGRLNAYGS